MTTDETGTPSRLPHRRRKSKVPLILSITMIIVTGAGVGWLAAKYLTSRVNDAEIAELSLPKFDDKSTQTGNSGAPAPENDAERDTAAVAENPVADIPKPGPQLRDLVVSSYSAEGAYALNEWQLGTAPSGFIDKVSLNGFQFDPAADAPTLNGGDVIELSGWTGDVSIGVRFPYVLVSACGKVIAHAPVDRKRPDVAKTVHENLGQSGWRVLVAAVHLPICTGRKLQVWGLAPGDRKLALPVNGGFALGGGPVEHDNSVHVIAAESEVRPASMAPLAPGKLTVTVDTLNMRRCGNAECPVTGKLSKGIWDVIELGETGDWLLVALPDRAGWISKRFVDMAQRGR